MPTKASSSASTTSTADTRVGLLLRPLGGEPFEQARAEYRGPTAYLGRERALFIAFPAHP